MANFIKQFLKKTASLIPSNQALINPQTTTSKFTPGRLLVGALPWSVVLLSIGIGLYFTLSIEGSSGIVAVSLALAAITWLYSQNTPKFHSLVAILLVIIIGYAVAFYRTHAVKTALLPTEPRSYELSMMVKRASPTQSNRIHYSGPLLSLSRIAPQKMPKQIRLRAPDQGPLFVYGDVICGKAIMARPRGPLRPGGYDFGWSLWFKQIGGTGFTISQLKLCNTSIKYEQSKLDHFIATLRSFISQRLDQGLTGRERALAGALILGDRGRIEKQDIEALRKAGLGHLLAISGLHMAAFAGTLFFLIRAGLALFPSLAQAQPIKKWAALAALIGASVYFLISGQSIPTQRAVLMISMIMLAILVERPAITLRNVVLAAILILLFRPESLLSPGFQMSFAAVTALIVAYEIHLKKAPFTKIQETVPQLVWFKPFYYMLGIWFTSLIATLATAPYSIYHFHQISYMGPLGNMLAIPLFTVLLMPLAVLSLCLMPFGLEGPILEALAIVIDMLLATAHWTASFDPAIIQIGQINPRAVILITLGAILAIFAPGRNKLLALPLVIIAVITAKPNQRPDIYIDDKGDVMAVRGADQKLYAPDGRKGAFVLSNWLKADGDNRTSADVRQNAVIACDEAACSGQVKGLTVTLLKNIQALEEECNRADILIYKRTIFRPCKNPQLKLTKIELTKGGAHAVYINKGKIRVERANQHRQNRIWAKGAE